MNFFNYFSIRLVFILIISFLLSGCSDLLKPDWSKTAEPNARKRARQNVEEGRGISGGGLFKNNSGGNYQFASSNPLWRGSLDVLDFMVLSTVDYSGGLIISDWYSENDPNNSIKITIRFLSNEVRIDSFDVIIHKRVCKDLQCSTKKVDNDLSGQIKDKILKKAAYYVKNDKAKIIDSQKGRPKISEKDRY